MAGSDKNVAELFIFREFHYRNMMVQQSLVQNQTVPDKSTPEVARPDLRQFSYLRRELGHVGLTDRNGHCTGRTAQTSGKP